MRDGRGGLSYDCGNPFAWYTAVIPEPDAFGVNALQSDLSGSPETVT